MDKHTSSRREKRQARAARRSHLALFRGVLRVVCELGQVEAQRIDREAKTEFQRVVGRGVIFKRTRDELKPCKRVVRSRQAPPSPRPSDLFAATLTAAPCAPPTVLASARRELAVAA